MKKKRTNSFVLFGRAFKNAKKDFWVSIQVLLVITIIVSIIFYFVEHVAQPEEYKNPWEAFVWAITRYIGDPGKFSGNGPVTLVGRYLDTFIGIMKILIFAVPAGLVANGFKKAMDDDKRARHLEACRESIMKSFSRRLNKATGYRMPPRNISIVTLQAKKGMTENDIIDTVARFQDFRLRNLATSQTESEHPQDRLVIEPVPLNKKTVDGFNIEKTEYGIKIDRNSNVTIIAPTSGTECTIGYFAYYVAQFGRFNFVSREFVNDVDDPISYFAISDETKEFIPNYIKDIKLLSKNNGEKHWNIVMISADNVHDTQVHFVHKIKKDKKIGTITIDEEKFLQFYSSISKTLKESHQLDSDLDEKYRPVGSKNICSIVGGGTQNNAFVMRISYSVTTWMYSFTPIALAMAKEIHQALSQGEDVEFKEHQGWKLKGNGFGVDEEENE